MTGQQLKELRESRNLTQGQLAALLGDCSGATISRWEQTDSEVPNWVSEKLLSNTELKLPLDLLQQLLAHATTEGIDFGELLARALRAYIQTPPVPAPKGKVKYPNPPPSSLRAAEDPPS